MALCAGLLVAALGEELGWSGYAIDPLQARWGALPASVGLGLFGAAYHYPGLVEIHRSFEWIVGWSLGTVASRVIIVWLYNNSGKRVFAAALFHMTINLTWQLFPVNGSFYDPRADKLDSGSHWGCRGTRVGFANARSQPIRIEGDLAAVVRGLRCQPLVTDRKQSLPASSRG